MFRSETRHPTATFTSLLVGACLLIAAAVGSVAAAAADGAVVTKKSAHSVSATLDRFEKILKSKGITVFTRIDHAAGAKKVGAELPATELIVFGNPKLGTPLMQAARSVGLDLPMKALAWADTDGTVYLSYTAPSALKSRHGIEGADKVIATMTKALDGLTTAATKAE
jgi:uncharacterized protein (DUF302 family)